MFVTTACLLMFLVEGHCAPLDPSLLPIEAGNNISVDLRLNFPKKYHSGKVRLEFDFDTKCDNPNQTSEAANPVIMDEVRAFAPQQWQHVPGHVLEDCNDVPYDEPDKSGIYTITLNGTFIPVYCEILPNTQKYLVFQRRFDGSVTFYNTWVEYEEGFGAPSGEFWLGNKMLHELTSKAEYRLRIELEAFDEDYAYAEYDRFFIGSPAAKYTLNVTGYSGSAGDSLAAHNGMKFTTIDDDNDEHAENCATLYPGGWWYTSCYFANLNGLYYDDVQASLSGGINWYHFKGLHVPLRTTKMMLTRVGRRLH